MLIYFIVFILTILLYKIAIKNKKINVVLIVCVVSLPSILAAVRDSNIGRDVELYVLPIWTDSIRCNSWEQFWDYNTEIETLYLLLNYGVSLITRNFNVFLFLHQALLVSIIILVALRYRNEMASEYVLAFYLFYLYNDTFSLMRQAISICISVLCFSLLLENKIKSFYIAAFIAFLGHSSAILLFLQHVVKFFTDKSSKRIWLIYGTIIIVFLFVHKMFQVFLAYFISSSILSEKYTLYIDQEGFSTHKIDLVFLITTLLSMHFITKKRNRINSTFNTVSVFVFVAFCMTMLGGIVEVANRAAYYYVAPLFFVLPLVTKSIKEKKRLIGTVLSALVFRFIYLGINEGIADTIPYSSKILGL